MSKHLTKRQIGNTGIWVNAIGLGGMPLSIGDRPTEAQGIEVIHAALKAGVDFIDTADVYCQNDDEIGHNERLFAKAIKSWSGHEVLVATKGGCTRPRGGWGTNGDPKHLRQACEKSLKALGVERIFLYQLHAIDDAVLLEDSLGEMAKLQSEGKISHIGVSNFSKDEIARALTVTRIESVQNRLNPLCQRDLNNGVLDFCLQNQLTYLAYSPVGGGRFHKELGQHKMLKEIGAQHHCSPHQVMLGWALSKGQNVLPIPGASKVSSILDSVKAALLTLSQDEMQAVDAIQMTA